jgi:hypothetical protein
MPERYHPAAAEMGGASRSIDESGAELRLHLESVRGFGWTTFVLMD